MVTVVSKSMNKLELIKGLTFRALIAILIVCGVLTSVKCGVYLLIVAGLLSGWYYGWYNDSIWEKRGQELSNKSAYRVHQLWIHMTCGVIAGLALYFLSNSYLNCPEKFISKLGWSDFFLFLISLLGFTGLLPRTLWFLARNGKIDGP
jgi:hypothetical protein